MPALVDRILELAERRDAHANEQLTAALSDAAVAMRDANVRGEYGATLLPKVALSLLSREGLNGQATRVVVNLLASNDMNRQRIIDHGGVEAIKRRIERSVNLGDLEDARNATSALANIVYGGERYIAPLQSSQMYDLLFSLLIRRMTDSSADNVDIWRSIGIWAGEVITAIYDPRHQLIHNGDAVKAVRAFIECLCHQEEDSFPSDLAIFSSIVSVTLQSSLLSDDTNKILFDHGMMDVIVDLALVFKAKSQELAESFDDLYVYLWHLTIGVSAERNMLPRSNGRLIESPFLEKLRTLLNTERGMIALAVYGNEVVDGACLLTENSAAAIAVEPGLIACMCRALDKDDEQKYIVFTMLRNFAISRKTRALINDRDISVQLINMAGHEDNSAHDVRPEERRKIHRLAMRILAYLAENTVTCELIKERVHHLIKAYYDARVASAVPGLLSCTVRIIDGCFDDRLPHLFADYFTQSYLDVAEVGDVVFALAILAHEDTAAVAAALAPVAADYFRIIPNMPLPLRHNMYVVGTKLAGGDNDASVEMKNALRQHLEDEIQVPGDSTIEAALDTYMKKQGSTPSEIPNIATNPKVERDLRDLLHNLIKDLKS